MGKPGPRSRVPRPPKAKPRSAKARVHDVMALLGLPHGVAGPGVQPKVLMRLQGRRCYLCTGDLTDQMTPGHKGTPLDPAFRTRDHVMPRILGGTHWRNVLLSCVDCNSRKSGRLPTPCELIYLAAINLQLEAMGK